MWETAWLGLDALILVKQTRLTVLQDGVIHALVWQTDDLGSQESFTTSVYAEKLQKDYCQDVLQGVAKKYPPKNFWQYFPSD